MATVFTLVWLSPPPIDTRMDAKALMILLKALILLLSTAYDGVACFLVFHALKGINLTDKNSSSSDSLPSLRLCKGSEVQVAWVIIFDFNIYII